MADDYRIVVIDDERIPVLNTENGMTLFLYENLKEATTALEYFHRNGLSIEELWLDHDLGAPEEVEYETIMPIVAWLEELGYRKTPFNVGTIFVHTSNPPAAEQMIAALNPYYDVVRAQLPTGKS